MRISSKYTRHHNCSL